jgi:hypothetical protein
MRLLLALALCSLAFGDVAADPARVAIPAYDAAGFSEDVPAVFVFNSSGEVVLSDVGSGAAERVAQALSGMPSRPALGDSRSIRERLLALPGLDGQDWAERLRRGTLQRPLLVSVVVSKEVFDCAGCTLYQSKLEELSPNIEQAWIELVDGK